MVRAMNGRVAQIKAATIGAKRVGNCAEDRPRKKSRFAPLADFQESMAHNTRASLDEISTPVTSADESDRSRNETCQNNNAIDRATRTDQNEEVYIDLNAYAIDSIVLGSGLRVGNRHMKKGVWYASQTAVGDAVSYFPIVRQSLTAPDCGVRPVSFTTKVLDATVERAPYECALTDRRALRHGHTSDSPNYFALEKVISFCKRNPGVAVVTGGGPGSRNPNPGLLRFRVTANEDLVMSNGILDCVPSSVVNGVQYFRGSEGVSIATSRLIKSTAKPANLGQVVVLVQGLGLKLALRKFKNRKELQRNKRDEAFNMVGGWTSGIWLVRLARYTRGRLDHCVLVNAKKGVILDSAESFPIRLCAESLRMCGGSDTSDLELVEVREMVEQNTM